MAKTYRADLHVHTCLSPCSDAAMVPTRMVREAMARGVDILGVTDHNSAENAMAVQEAGARAGLQVVTGMEITSREEVHTLGFFDAPERLAEMQALVYENLPGRNEPEVFGAQYVVDDWDYVVGLNDRLLIGATELSIEEIVAAIHRLDGLAIASHVDREAFSLIGQLGFVPDDIDLDALEISAGATGPPPDLQRPGASGRGSPVVQFSDAHRLEDIGAGVTELALDQVSVGGIRAALAAMGDGAAGM